MTQNPVININVPRQEQDHAIKVPPSKPTDPPDPTKSGSKEQDHDPRPKFETLAPRIAFVMPHGESFIDGFVEEGKEFRAVLAVVRMYRPAADASETFITARLTYRTKENICLRSENVRLFDIHYGTWLEEGFNFVKMTLTDTKELILAMEFEGKCLAVQDNRHSVEKRRDFTYKDLPESDPFYVDVTLTDEKYGNLISFTYEIQAKPLGVEPILRVPRGPLG